MCEILAADKNISSDVLKSQLLEFFDGDVNQLNCIEGQVSDNSNLNTIHVCSQGVWDLMCVINTFFELIDSVLTI